MKLTQLAAGLLVFGASCTAFGQAVVPTTSCEALAKLALPQATITMAQTVAAGEYKLPVRNLPPGMAAPPPGAIPPDPTDPNPAFCRVAATLTPTSDSDIKIEVWMPLAGWNGNFHGVANMGWAGSIVYNAMLDSIQHGFAAASTDTGHVSVQGQPNGTFLVGHPEKLIDYGHRSVHLMTVNGKAIVKAFYGKAAKFALFTGCSLGGMQAVVEAYRYPEDYDGIVAGAPANPMTMFNAAQLWPYWAIKQNPARQIPAEKFKMIHEAALKACAGPVGLKQGFIEDPERCHFDPQSLLCKAGDGPDCLTAPQAELMKLIYQGPLNQKTHELIFPGPPVGGELQLGQYTAAQPMGNAVALYRYGVYGDPNWEFSKMDYDTSIELAKKNVDPAMKAGNDLTPFLKRGGKLMLYVGWTDYHHPMELAGYYNTVKNNAGGDKVADSLRLFLIPGMDHCFGGYGCDNFDKLGTIAKWVETGKAPDVIPASKIVGNQTIRTAKICAYPKVPQYKGTGDMEAAESFACVTP